MLIEYEQMNLEEYKKSIQVELEYEELLLKRVDEDPYIKNKEFVKNRIQTRINIIKEELNQQIENEPENQALDEEAIIKEKNYNEVCKNENVIKEPSKESKEIKIEEKIIEKKPSKEIKVKIEDKIKDKRLYEDTKIKADEYKQAVDYFLQIESMKQADDAREKAKVLNQALFQMEEGKSVDEFSLPISVTPDYICNMSKQERLNNFSIIIKDFSAKKNELNEKLEKAINGFKGIDKKFFVKHVRNNNIY
jgi:hypothetical protein